MRSISLFKNIPQEKKMVGIWLLSIYTALVVLIGLGGITRLTHSGLSIVEWKPITGIVPPISQASWELEFNKYKTYPEFKKVQTQLNLKAFKRRPNMIANPKSGRINFD